MMVWINKQSDSVFYKLIKEFAHKDIRMKNFETQSLQTQNLSQPFTSPPHDLFSQAKTKCIKDNQGIYACTQHNCTHPNPFICNNQQCQCSIVHFDCGQKKVQSLIKSLQQRRNQFAHTQKVISEVLDEVNLNFSTKWDNVIDKLKAKSQGFGPLFDNLKEEKQLGEVLDQNKLTGSILSKIFNSRKLQSQNNHQKQLISKIRQRAKEFQQKQLTNFFNYIQLQLFDQQIQFHPKWINKTLQRVSHLRLRCVTHQKDDNFSLGLIQPTINEMLKGQHKIIKWRVKIHFITHWIGIGICLKKFLQKKDFNFNNYQIADHGSFIISSNQYIWAHRNKDRNFKKDGAFKLIMGDVIDVRLDMKNREITFSNDRLNRETTLKITYDPENDDEYCITLGMYQQGDEAEIVEPIKICSEEEDLKERMAEGKDRKGNVRRQQVDQRADLFNSFIYDQSDAEGDAY